MKQGPLVLIDNYDSFTYNLSQVHGKNKIVLGRAVAVFDSELKHGADWVEAK